MSVAWRKSVVLQFILLIIGPAVVAAMAGEPASPSAILEVADIKFDPITSGKNVVTVTVHNLTDRAQVLVTDVRTQPAPQGGGRQTQFPESLGPKEHKTLCFGYAFSAAPESDGFVRLRFYDFRPTEDQQFGRFFQEVRHSVAEIGLRSARPAASRASPQVA